MKKEEASSSQPLLDLLARVKAGWPGPAWQWDDRFGCVLSTIPKADEAKARAATTAHLASVWTTGTLESAPPSLRTLCGSVGGLRPGQTMLGAGPADGRHAYALFWPWGNGAMISVRLGIAPAERGDPALDALRALFGL